MKVKTPRTDTQEHFQWFVRQKKLCVYSKCHTGFILLLTRFPPEEQHPANSWLQTMTRKGFSGMFLLLFPISTFPQDVCCIALGHYWGAAEEDARC